MSSRIFSILFATLLVFVASACGAGGPEVKRPDPNEEAAANKKKPVDPEERAAAPKPPPGDFRKVAPAPGPAVVFSPPKIEEARLANGIRVLHAERRELPIVAVQVSADRGADQAGPGVASFAASMLLQGTKTRSAIAISDEIGRLGASAGAGADYDSVGVGARCLTPKLPELLALLADIVINPAFDPAEIKRERSRRLTSILQQNDRPAILLSNAVASALYPAGHPYSAPILGLEPDVTKVSAAELASFHASSFRPDRVTIAIAGDITKDRAVEEIQRVFTAWQGKAQPAKEVGPPPLPDAKAARILLLDRPGATQSQVAVALPGVPRVTKDFEVILLMNTILGGQFSSRLNLNLREKHAYSYGVRSNFDMRRGPGPFVAGGAIVRESTGPAVREILAEMKRLQAELVTAEELDDARSNLILQLPARFESAAETASTLAYLATYGLPLDEIATRPARLKAVTRDDVKRAAESYLKADLTRIVIVGDAKVIKAQLDALGIGSVELLPAAGGKTPAAGKTLPAAGKKG
ncbi:MAG TPA: pitrilysin family protein [Polyangiaceae bacterium]|nr:pitrilysin family protein [Polyangiaceae bacterium]